MSGNSNLVLWAGAFGASIALHGALAATLALTPRPERPEQQVTSVEIQSLPQDMPETVAPAPVPQAAAAPEEVETVSAPEQVASVGEAEAVAAVAPEETAAPAAGELATVDAVRTDDVAKPRETGGEAVEPHRETGVEAARAEAADVVPPSGEPQKIAPAADAPETTAPLEADAVEARSVEDADGVQAATASSEDIAPRSASVRQDAVSPPETAQPITGVAPEDIAPSSEAPAVEIVPQPDASALEGVASNEPGDAVTALAAAGSTLDPATASVEAAPQASPFAPPIASTTSEETAALAPSVAAPETVMSGTSPPDNLGAVTANEGIAVVAPEALPSEPVTASNSGDVRPALAPSVAAPQRIVTGASPPSNSGPVIADEGAATVPPPVASVTATATNESVAAVAPIVAPAVSDTAAATSAGAAVAVAPPASATAAVNQAPAVVAASRAAAIDVAKPPGAGGTVVASVGSETSAERQPTVPAPSSDAGARDTEGTGVGVEGADVSRQGPEVALAPVRPSLPSLEAQPVIDPLEEVTKIIGRQGVADCFLALADRRAKAIEVDGYATTPAALDQLDHDLANVPDAAVQARRHKVAAAQCEALSFARSIAGRPVADLPIRPAASEIASGTELSGVIENLRRKRLYLLVVDDEGKVQEVDNLFVSDNRTIGFKAPFTLTNGPVDTVQLLVAVASDEPLATFDSHEGEQADVYFAALAKEIADAGGGVEIGVAAFIVR